MWAKNPFIIRSLFKEKNGSSIRFHRLMYPLKYFFVWSCFLNPFAFLWWFLVLCLHRISVCECLSLCLFLILFLYLFSFTHSFFLSKSGLFVFISLFYFSFEKMSVGFLTREIKRGSVFEWVGWWRGSQRSWGREVIIRIYCISIYFQ